MGIMNLGVGFTGVSNRTHKKRDGHTRVYLADPFTTLIYLIKLDDDQKFPDKVQTRAWIKSSGQSITQDQQRSSDVEPHSGECFISNCKIEGKWGFESGDQVEIVIEAKVGQALVGTLDVTLVIN